MKNFVLLLMVMVVISSCTTMVSTKGEPMNKKELKTVKYVDINKYLGTWHEIGKIPNRFQRKCQKNTTATYSLRKDGQIEVVNRCVSERGDTIFARGIAKIVDPSSNAKLKVSFVKFLGIQLFWGDYWIIGLDKNYRYAIVGTPSRKYGWILSRTPELPENILMDIFKLLKTQGYDPDEFQMTLQTEVNN